MRDAVLFHGTMAYAAGHLDMLLERQPQPETLMKKTQAIRMIKERISCNTKALSNSTIGAIAMLASLEVRVYPQLSRIEPMGQMLHLDANETSHEQRANGNFEGLHIHELAIGKLISLRGGLTHLGCRVLETFISSYYPLTNKSACSSQLLTALLDVEEISLPLPCSPDLPNLRVIPAPPTYRIPAHRQTCRFSIRRRTWDLKCI